MKRLPVHAPAPLSAYPSSIGYSTPSTASSISRRRSGNAQRLGARPGRRQRFPVCSAPRRARHRAAARRHRAIQRLEPGHRHLSHRQPKFPRSRQRELFLRRHDPAHQSLRAAYHAIRPGARLGTLTFRSPQLWHRAQVHLAYSNQIAEFMGAITGGGV